MSRTEITDPFERRVAVLLSSTATVTPDGALALTYSQEAKLLARAIATLEKLGEELEASAAGISSRIDDVIEAARYRQE